ncbi:hypothetical protein SAMN04487891_106167 [Flagellimonas taeanensis]|jgi:hypothetical protein|uniref:Uncharacterized protein n=1 Tax=Flagellimonas taeanensis TaxID=1005926 RepID=A0A1M6YU45_9FLAO|nr:hypothetical protein [Allomuricauda taeanensis]SFC14167.1 hypothetical protein SAMN04487891_106167 [Allomuricauda taeanensis]SHL21768.1 hypothetical protein SAMN05216293_2951 [Allomuricauda taeanensis]
MNRNVFFFILFFACQLGIGQQLVLIDGGNQGKYGFMGGDSSIKGTKYYFNGWGAGKITFSDQTTSKPMLIQVDLELNNLLVKDDQDDTKGTIVNMNTVEKFTLTQVGDKTNGSTTDTFVKKSPSDFGGSVKETKYYRQRTKDTDYVIEEISKRLHDNATDTTNNFDKKSYEEYRTKNTFYVKGPEGKYIESSNLGERAIAKAYPDLKKEIKNYVKANNIDFDNPTQLDALISFCLMTK